MTSHGSAAWAAIVCLSVGFIGFVLWDVLATNRLAASLTGDRRTRTKRDYRDGNRIGSLQLVPTLPPPGANGGAIYTRWGRASCPPNINTELVYNGVAGGSNSDMTGGGSDYICLPRIPQWDPQSFSLESNTTTTAAPTTTTTVSARARRRQNRRTGTSASDTSDDQTRSSSGSSRRGQSAYIYGGEFRGRAHFRTDNLRGSTFIDQDVVCSVCYSTVRRTQMMIPARRECFSGWTKEYEGFLMTAHSTAQAQHHYACVDRKPEVDQKGYEEKGGALFYPVRAICGSLPCPNYVQGWALTCVVCTR